MSVERLLARLPSDMVGVLLYFCRGHSRVINILMAQSEKSFMLQQKRENM